MAKKMITVKVPAHSDPALKGKARARKPGAPGRFFTESPETVEHTSDIARMILVGDLVETTEAPVEHDERRVGAMMSPEEAKADFKAAMGGGKR